MTDAKSGPQGRRTLPPLSEAAAARRRAFETSSGERAWRDQTAREVLDKRSVEKELGGRWACHVGRCYDGISPESMLHRPAVLTLIHVSRAFELYRTVIKPVLDKSIPEEWARSTDRAPVCRRCQEFMRDRVRFDDTPDWETTDNAR